MRQRTFISLALIVFLAIVSGWLALSNPTISLGDINREIKVHLGLDLQGGLRVLLRADVPEGTTVDPASLEVARGIIENRVNALGVTEPLVQVQGSNRIVVELPGIQNPDEAIKVFGSTGLLEFVDAGSVAPVEGELISTTGPSPANSCSGAVAQQNPTPTITPSSTISPTDSITPTNPVAPTRVFTTVMTGDCLDANVTGVQFDPTTNQPIIGFGTKGEGTRIFGDFTTNNVGKYLAIVLDKRVISAPVINSPITGGNGVIEGRFTATEAQNLAVQLKFGSLPIPLVIETTTNIGPTLGQDSVDRSLVAGAIGLGIVSLFMLLFYRLPGVVAVIALTIYGLISFTIYKVGIPGFFPYVTLTLPGIAGFVLSLGVAVDSNFLVFERMKEELRAGRPLSQAVEIGFDRAWSAILDSNVAMVISAIILFWFGSSFGASLVAGFALTFGIGVMLSIFTAVFVTRTILRFIIDVGLFPNLWWWGIKPDETGTHAAPEPKITRVIDFVGKRRWYFLLSILMIVPGLVAIGVNLAQTGVPFQLGIDFTGGTNWEITDITRQPTTDEVRAIFGRYGIRDATPIPETFEGKPAFLIRSSEVRPEVKTQIANDLRPIIGNFTEVRFESAGPLIGAEVAQRAAIAVLLTSIGVLLYMAFAFRNAPHPFRYGICAIIAMLHDILVVLGATAIFGILFGWQFDALVLTALLTVIGFAINDTIVVFDRIRENVKRIHTESFDDIVNHSIMETLGRSLNTQLAVAFTLTALTLFGGVTTQQFTLTMLIGLISVTYSSIFNAAQLLVVWEHGGVGNFFRRLIGRQREATAPSNS
jgi:protein-export membrane protein SecD/preprotein translocase SecF subunit